jgi:hypothetical protein
LHRHSIISSVARCVICGAGPYGYILGMQAAAQMLGALPISLSRRIASLSPSSDSAGRGSG